MSADEDDDNSDFAEKTNIYNNQTVKIERAADYRVPPCLVLIVGPPDQMGKQWIINKSQFIIGRTPSAEVHVQEVSLSKVHAQLDINSDGVTITDKGSTNHTFIEGRQLVAQQPYKLKNNDQFRAGSLVFKFLERGILSETNEKARMQSELEGARNVQENLFPENSEARYSWIQVGGKYQSATECGGDWWWHWMCGNKAFALLGDATGHGAAAALITSAARSAIATIEDDETVGVDKVYMVLSNAIRKVSGGKLAMSAFLVEADLATRKLRYINASHLPAVLLPLQATELTWKNVEHLAGNICAPLGVGDSPPKINELVAPNKTRLVLLTDGLTERMDKHGMALSERTFAKMLLQAHQTHPNSQSAFLNALISQSDILSMSAPLNDDITIVALDFT